MIGGVGGRTAPGRAPIVAEDLERIGVFGGGEIRGVEGIGRVGGQLHSTLVIVSSEHRGIRQLNVNARGQRSGRIAVKIRGIVPRNVSPRGGSRRVCLR